MILPMGSPAFLKRLGFPITLTVVMLMSISNVGISPAFDARATTITVNNEPVYEPDPGSAASWQIYDSPTTNDLSSIKMVSPTDGWAVGTNGTILHWDGTTWSVVPSPVTATLVDVSIVPGSNGTDGWIVGDQSAILRWNGSVWSVFDNRWYEFPSGYGYQDPRMFNSVWLTSATDGWLSDPSWGRLLRWRGSQWGNNGDGLYGYSSGSASSVVMVSTTDGWFVGNYIGHWNGYDWALVTDPNPYGSHYYNDVTMTPGTNSTDGWIIGDGGAILRWNGSTWSNATSPTSENLLDLAMLSSSEGWAAGSNGTLLHWNGSNWSGASSPTTKSLYSIAMVSASEGWAVGEGGTMLHYTITNDDFDYAYEIPEPPANGLSVQELDLNTTDATIALDDPNMGCGIGTNSNTLWYQLTPTYYGLLQVHTLGSSYNTVLAAYTGSRGSLQRITCNDDSDGTLQSKMSFDVEAGKTYFIEAANYGVSSGGGVLSLTAKYIVSPKAWTLMFYTVGEDPGLAMTYSQTPPLFERTSKNLNVNVVRYWDGPIAQGDTRYEVYSPYGRVTDYKGELNSGDKDTLKQFIEWATLNYPANRYALIISDHGHGIGGVAMDVTSNNDWLTPPELKAALSGLSVSHLDVIYMEACLMGTIEVEYQLRGLVDYYVAHQPIMFVAPRPDCIVLGSRGCGSSVDETVAITSQTSSYELSLAMAYNYAFWFQREEYPGAVSVVDINQVGNVADSAHNLAGLLRQQMGSILVSMTQIGAEVQRYTESTEKNISLTDRVVDLYDFAELVQAKISDPNIQQAAIQLKTAIGNYVKYSEAWGGTYQGYDWPYNNSHTHGVSIFFPPVDKLPTYYTGEWLDFASGTSWLMQTDSGEVFTPNASEWGPMLEEYIDQLDPSAPEDPNPPAPVAPLCPQWRNYLPLVEKENSSTSTTIYGDTADGEIIATCADWTACRNATSGSMALNGYKDGTVQASYYQSSYYIKRIFFFFDTSAIPSNANLTSAVLNIYAGPYQHAQTTFHVVKSTAGIPLANSDFGNILFTSGGSATPPYPNSWISINLSTSAFEWIIKGGTTKLALVHNMDLNNTIPNEANDLLVALSENSPYRPYLVLTYSH